ncbi:MAG: methylated-DNA--[protein]-cysteine S-methyltransferase [Candidatus Aminicenantes bacterium]|nr:MAG: methylated-DNA--[protein]-cysteine S-methyltransferase [Candidatus Aminicenantes bacterium]
MQDIRRIKMKEQVLNRAIFDTPYGKMVALSTGKGLGVLEFIKPNRREMLTKRLNKWFSNYEIIDDPGDTIAMTGEWLTDYFSGEFERLTTPPLDLRGTEFELKVWHALLRIPLGETVTYQHLAAELGIPKGSRAVGGANRRNPVSLIVPCHRVIGQNGSLVGYGGGLEVKKALISHERAAARPPSKGPAGKPPRPL